MRTPANGLPFEPALVLAVSFPDFYGEFDEGWAGGSAERRRQAVPAIPKSNCFPARLSGMFFTRLERRGGRSISSCVLGRRGLRKVSGSESAMNVLIRF